MTQSDTTPDMLTIGPMNDLAHVRHAFSAAAAG